MGVDPSRWTTSASIQPNIIRYLVRVADERGVSLDRALYDAGLSREALDAVGLRVSYRQGRAIISAALQHGSLGTTLGLDVGLRQPITASGELGLAMMSSATIADAIDVGITFQNLAGSMMRWSAERDGEDLTVTVAAPEDDPHVGRFLVEEGFANVTRMVRDTTDPAFAPVRVEFAYAAPDDTSPYEECFRSPVLFGRDRNAWALNRSQWSREIPSWDPWTRKIAVELLTAAVGHGVERQEIVATLSAQVEAALPDVLPLRTHARSLALSERTLRRRLADLDTSYADVVDEVRRRRAAHLIRDTNLPFTTIAAAVGYHDDRSLRRSTLRWFGTTPREVRRTQA